jgi:hypothetical protein
MNDAFLNTSRPGKWEDLPQTGLKVLRMREQMPQRRAQRKREIAAKKRKGPR